jgi:hypothetical protein
MFPKDREAADGNKRGKEKMDSGLKPVQRDAAVLDLDPPVRSALVDIDRTATEQRLRDKRIAARLASGFC